MQSLFDGWLTSRAADGLCGSVVICALLVLSTSCSPSEPGNSPKSVSNADRCGSDHDGESGGDDERLLGRHYIGVVPRKVVAISQRGFDAYFPVTSSPVPGFDEGTVSDDIRSKYESGELKPTDAEWYDTPPQVATTGIIHGFEWNALKVELPLRAGDIFWLPLVIQNEAIENTSSTGENGLPAGSFSFRPVDPILLPTGEITGFTDDGEFSVTVPTGKTYSFRPVMCGWYSAQNQQGRSELRFVFGTGFEPWPRHWPEEEAGLPAKLRTTNTISVREMMLQPYGLESLPD